MQAAVSGLEEHLKPALDVQQHELDQVCLFVCFSVLVIYVAVAAVMLAYGGRLTLHISQQVPPQQQAEFHLTVARGLAAIYSLYAKTAGIPIKSFQKDLVSCRSTML